MIGLNGLINRYHGGAGIATSTENVAYTKRKMLCFKKKQKIAKMVARAIIDNFRKVFLVADHTKFGRNAMVRLGNITEIDALFTDQAPPSVFTELINSADVRLFSANP